MDVEHATTAAFLDQLHETGRRRYKVQNSASENKRGTALNPNNAKTGILIVARPRRIWPVRTYSFQLRLEVYNTLLQSEMVDIMSYMEKLVAAGKRI